MPATWRFIRSSAGASEPDDETLMRLILHSSEDALARLYERHRHQVFNVALLIVEDWHTAEEVTLEVFWRVWRRAASYRPEKARVATWLARIARHQAIDILRRDGVRPDQQALRLDEVDHTALPSPGDPEDLADETLHRQRIRALIQSLPDEQCEVLMLTYYGGLTQPQIAAVLGQPLGTIKTRVKLAKQKMRALLRDARGQGPDHRSRPAG